jgi:hypothetical protein
MIYVKRLAVLFFIGILSLSCQDDLDDVPATGRDINNFIYRGMSSFYLYKPDVPLLANDRFETQFDLEQFHSQFTPEQWFEQLVFDRENVDRFSILVNDYVALENALSGQRLSNGMEFGLVAEEGSATGVYGYVRYVQPGSNAEAQGVQRGMIFNRISGSALTRSNFRTLLAPDVYTIGLANLNNGTTSNLPTEIQLTKTQFQENPILIANVIDQGTDKVGYLMYNSFLSQFDEQLNNVFADFAAQGVNQLVLDLRYNGGGSVNTAIILGSLIAGRPTSEVFSTEQWNPENQAFFEANDPERLVNFFRNTTTSGTALNSLNLSKVRILTTRSSASASELVINALNPYVDLIQIGDRTSGKFQASITVYDSPNFSRNGANPAHRYAMQPLVLKAVNSVGVTDFINGLDPDIELREDFENLGTLGDPSEPLLARALQDISLNGRGWTPQPSRSYDEISGSTELVPFGNEMWKDMEEVPLK